MYRCIVLVCLICMIGACSGVPEGIQPVQRFDLNRYTGTWYEIARLDHSFERGLSRVTATYSVREDGNVRVLNRGFDAREGEWKEAEGVARFVGDANVGHLEVSFFGPFYSSYVVFEMPSAYQVAYVAGYKQDYLWLLARTPTITDSEKQRFLTRVDHLGFNADAIIWVEQVNDR